jgi:hypothetical protein
VITDPTAWTVARSPVGPAAPVAVPPPDKYRIRRSLVAVTVAAIVLGGGAYVSAGGSAPEGVAPETSLESGFEQVPGAAVGRVADTEMFAAVLADEDLIRVYLCNGTVDEGTVDVWFEGPWDGAGPVNLVVDAFEISIAADEDSFVGELRTVDGHAWPFRAELPQTTAAGLYRGPRTNPDTGEIVFKHLVMLDNGDARGTFAPVVTRCRYLKRTRVLADGTTQEYIVQVCG